MPRMVKGALIRVIIAFPFLAQPQPRAISVLCVLAVPCVLVFLLFSLFLLFLLA